MKSKATKSTSKPKSNTPKVEVDGNSSIEARKIENGYIVSERGYTGKGRNEKWYNKEYFTTVKPNLSVSQVMKFGKK